MNAADFMIDTDNSESHEVAWDGDKLGHSSAELTAEESSS